MARLWLTLRFTCAALCLGILVSVGYWYATGGRIYSVQTDSMQPAIAAGDAVMVEPVSVDWLSKGDIVTYRDSARPNVIVTHRLLERHATARTLTTKGDNNAVQDLSISEGQVIGRATAVAPKLGYVLNALKNPVGLIIGLYVPTLIFVVYEILRWQKHSRHKNYVFNKV